MSRAGFSLALEERLRCVAPTAYLHVDAVAPLRESSKRTKAQWAAATGSGWETLPDGGIRLTGSLAALVEHTTNTGYLTDLLDDGTAFAAVQVQWGGAESSQIALERVKLYLHPRQDGGQPQEVVRWRVRLYAVAAADATTVELIPISDYVDVTAGASAALVTFDLTTQVTKVRPKTIQPSIGPGSDNDYIYPVTFVVVHALKGDGQSAGNVGLGYDAGAGTVTTAGNRLASRVLTRQSDGVYLLGGSAGGCPRVTIDTASFTAATATFQDAGNRLDLGATPTQLVEFLARAELPPGTAATFEVRNDADAAWVAFADGQLTTDLVGVGKNQTYKVRVTLTPDAGGDVTPVVRLIGVREIQRTELKNLTVVQGPRWSVDPITMKGEIGECILEVIRDGETDFRDAISDLLATNNPGALTFEIRVADPNLSRADWLHVDTFVLDETEWSAAAARLTLVTQLARLRQRIPRPVRYETTGATLTFAGKTAQGVPPQIQRAAGSFIADGWKAGDVLQVTGSASNDGFYTIASVAALVLILANDDTVTGEVGVTTATLAAFIRRPYAQGNATLQDVWDDLIDNQLAVPGRIRGPGVDDDTTQVTGTFRDGDAKAMLDAIAYLAGGGNISSQGQVKFVSLLAARGLTAVFPKEEIQVLAMSPGYRRRTAEIFVPFDWDAVEERFRGQVQGLNTAAFTALGEAYIEPARVPEEISRWIGAESLAQTIADQFIRFRGTGVIEWRFHSTYCYPDLEPGDLVAVEAEPFVLRDPFTGAAVRGRMWALGVIRAVDGCWGQDLTVWIRQFSDLLPAYTSLELDQLTAPPIEAYFTPLKGSPGQVQVRLVSHFGATIKYVVQDQGAAEVPYGAAAYLTYTNPFNVGQLESVDRLLHAYAERNGLRSAIRPWLIDKDTEPEVTLTLSEPTAGTLRVAWTADDDVVLVRLYRKIAGGGNGWPTTTNNIDGPLDEAQLIGTIHVRADGGAWDRIGSPLAGMLAGPGIGGTTWQETGYATEVVKVIVVPMDRNGNAGARVTASRTMAGASGAALDAFSAFQTAAGSSCVAPAEITVGWAPNGAVVDATHNLRIYRRVTGSGWNLRKTELNPASVFSYVDDVDDFEDAGSGIVYDWEYSYELVDGVPTVLDTGQSELVSIESSGTCPLS